MRLSVVGHQFSVEPEQWNHRSRVRDKDLCRPYGTREWGSANPAFRDASHRFPSTSLRAGYWATIDAPFGSKSKSPPAPFGSKCKSNGKCKVPRLHSG